MNNVSTLAPGDFEKRQLALVRRTVAADTSDDEFNLFAHTARHLRLDPLRRQIYAFVYSKDNPKKRRMSIVVAIDGFRAIADRTGNYRPDEDEPSYEFDPEQKSALNPAGLVKATVRVFKFAHGSWHRVTASAYWEEYAPLKDQWEDDPETGRGRKTGKQTLDTSGNWGKMPRLMLAKVAEALAIRKAWPDDLSNVYAPEEVERSRVVDMLASEAAAEGASSERLERIGAGNSIMFQFGANCPLEQVPLGRIADRISEHLGSLSGDPAAVQAWEMQNRHGLREWWARDTSGDPLRIKGDLEKLTRPNSARAAQREARPQ